MRKPLRHHFARLRLADEGQALVLVAFGLMMLMLFAALGVDIGYLHYQKEQLQKAADAGAIAAATALSYGGDFNAAALNDIIANGFTNGQNGVAVAVNNPPLAPDPFAGNSNYVQVVVTQQIAPAVLNFLNLAKVNPVYITSQAVANAAGNSSGCIYAMDPSDSGTFLVDGAVDFASSCGIYVESNNADALIEHGNSGGITVSGVGSTIGIVGTDPGYSADNITPTPVTGIPVFNDPLATVPQPANPGGCTNAVPNGSNAYSPGCYYGINVPAGGNGNNSYTLMAGTYFLCGGGLTVNGNSTLSGSNVTFVLTSCPGGHSYAGITITGNSNLTLSAPTSGPLKGILFFQDRTVPVGSAASTFDGTSGASFTGALYFPTTNIYFKGTPNFQSQVAIVAWELEFKGNANIQDNFLPNFGSPIPGAVLVE
jgi:hypothetical protein